MNAIINAPTRASKPRATRAVAEVVPLPQPFEFGSGRHLVVDNNNLAWPECDRGDILDIDFDVHEYRGEGHYLVQHVPPADEVVGPPGCFPFSTGWTKVVRLGRYGPTPGVAILESGINGREWRTVSQEQWERFRFMGRVKGLYCRRDRGRTNNLDVVGRVSAIGEAADGSAFIQFQPGEGRTITVSGLTDDEARRVAELMLSPARLEIKP